jgi:hypothetical protein
VNGYLWGTVLFDEEEGLFKMWYQTWGRLAFSRHATLVCYATSKDGLHWEKPELGLHEFEGSTRNNILLTPQADWLDSPTVIKDLDDPDPARRYKMSLYECGGNPKLREMSRSSPLTGIWHVVSPDGIHWTRLPGPVVKAGDRTSFLRDPIRHKWVVITRMPDYGERTIGFAEGDEFGVYGPMRLIFQRDERDPQQSDLYSMPTFAYEGMLIGCVEVYEHPSGREITQLAWSYDGEHWTRDPERQPFLLWSEPPAWDWARRHPHNGPILVRDDKLWLYFGGRSTLKNSTDPRTIVGAIGLSFLRIDGFCSCDAGEQEGILTTRPLLLNDGELHVNADVKPGGALEIELLNAAGAPIAGFSRAECVTLSGDRIDHPVRWRSRLSLRQVARHAVCLRFHLRETDLYSFRIR